MDTFSKDEMMLISDGLLELIGKANKAVSLVPDPATHDNRSIQELSCGTKQ